MAIFLAVVGSVAAVLGLLLASQATQGVALIAFGCFLGILSRLAQAHAHHVRAFPAPAVEEWKPGPVESKPWSATDKLLMAAVVVAVLVAIAFKIYWNSI